MTHAMTTMPKYESYKKHDIGELPTTWEIRRFRNVFTFSKGLNITKENLEDEGIPCINYGEIHSKLPFEVAPSRHKLKCVNEEYLKQNQKSLINKGDIIFADTSEDIEGSGNFSQLVEDATVFAGYHTIIVRPNDEYEDRFLAYLLDSTCYREQIQRAVKGVKVYSITNKILKSTSLWLPSKTEQSAIAMFLDEKTVQIDEAIGIKEQQIALLKERKQIIIQNAVTKGLNPSAPMKDSGVDWIGDIPEHWEVRKLKQIFYEKKHTANMSLNCGSISFGKVIEKDDESVLESTKRSYQEVLKGEFLLNPLNLNYDLKSLRIALSEIDVVVSAGYIVLKEKQNINKQYFKYLLYLFDVFHMKLMGSGVRQTINFGHIANSLLIFPSLEEQEKISAHIDIECKKIETGIAAQMAQIEKFKEYKASLINSAVTGKIKVI